MYDWARQVGVLTGDEETEAKPQPVFWEFATELFPMYASHASLGPALETLGVVTAALREHLDSDDQDRLGRAFRDMSESAASMGISAEPRVIKGLGTRIMFDREPMDQFSETCCAMDTVLEHLPDNDGPTPVASPTRSVAKHSLKACRDAFATVIKYHTFSLTWGQERALLSQITPSGSWLQGSEDEDQVNKEQAVT